MQEARSGAPAKDLLAGTKLVDMIGFSGTPTRSSDTLKPAWSPDGKFLVFNATTNLDEAAHARVIFHLYKIAAAGGEPEQITSSSDWSCTGPVFSDDGKSLYCDYEAENSQVYNLSGIGRFDWSDKGISGEPELVTAGFDRSVTGMEISPDSETIYLTARDAGRARVYSVPAKGGTVKALNKNSRGVYANVVVAGNYLVARWESSAVPAEIVPLTAATLRLAVLIPKQRPGSTCRNSSSSGLRAARAARFTAGWPCLLVSTKTGNIHSCYKCMAALSVRPWTQVMSVGVRL